jgi:hypothetical protein
LSAALEDAQFDLDGELTFGLDLPVTTGTPSIGEPSLTDQDVEVDRADRVRFGRDHRRSRTVTFDLTVDATPDTVQGYADQVETAWNAAQVRTTPGAVSVLRYRKGGQTRRCYGRPRKIAPVVKFYHSGRVDYTAEFVTRDPCFYADQSSSVTVDIVPPESSAGLTVPFTVPFIFAGQTSSQGYFRVGGSEATPIVVTIHGPIIDPTVTLTSGDVTKRVFLAGHVNVDDHVTIDPTTHTVLSSFGTNWAGGLSARSTPLSEIGLPPGLAHVLLSGHDHTGTASATVTWRSAYASF